MKTSVSWLNAKTKCESENGTLASILNNQTNNFLREQIEDGEAFVGGFYEQGSWKWISNETFRNYNSWEQDHPKTKASEGSNLEMVYGIEDSKWEPASPGLYIYLNFF